MDTIAFIDTEIEPKSGRILDIGGIKEDGSPFHSGSVSEFIKFLRGSKYVCDQNIFNHDLKYIRESINAIGLTDSNCIDTLHLSPLLFPTRPYHALLKDAKKAQELFDSEVVAIQQLDEELKRIF